MSTVPINPAVALAEAEALVDYYRNRNLLLAQAVAELRARLRECEAAPALADPEEVTQ